MNYPRADELFKRQMIVDLVMKLDEMTRSSEFMKNDELTGGFFIVSKEEIETYILKMKKATTNLCQKELNDKDPLYKHIRLAVEKMNEDVEYK